MMADGEFAELHLDRQCMSRKILAQHPQAPVVGWQFGLAVLNDNETRGAVADLADESGKQGHFALLS